MVSLRFITLSILLTLAFPLARLVRAQDLNSIVNNDLNVDQGKSLIVKFYEDLQSNINYYAYKYLNGDQTIILSNLPSQYGPIVDQLITYTDDSFSTLLDDPRNYQGSEEDMVKGLLLGIEGFGWWGKFVSTVELIPGSLMTAFEATATPEPVASLTSMVLSLTTPLISDSLSPSSTLLSSQSLITPVTMITSMITSRPTSTLISTSITSKSKSVAVSIPPIQLSTGFNVIPSKNFLVIAIVLSFVVLAILV